MGHLPQNKANSSIGKQPEQKRESTLRMLFDADEDSQSLAELESAKRDARENLRLWRKRTFYSAAAFFLSCSLLYLFLAGSPLHRYWLSGRYFIPLSLALLPVFLFCAVMWWATWRALCDLESIT